MKEKIENVDRRRIPRKNGFSDTIVNELLPNRKFPKAENHKNFQIGEKKRQKGDKKATDCRFFKLLV